MPVNIRIKIEDRCAGQLARSATGRLSDVLTTFTKTYVLQAAGCHVLGPTTSRVELSMHDQPPSFAADLSEIISGTRSRGFNRANKYATESQFGGTRCGSARSTCRVCPLLPTVVFFSSSSRARKGTRLARKDHDSHPSSPPGSYGGTASIEDPSQGFHCTPATINPRTL